MRATESNPVRHTVRLGVAMLWVCVPVLTAPGEVVDVRPAVDVGASRRETHIAVNPCDPSHAVGVWISYRDPEAGEPNTRRMASTNDAGVSWQMRFFDGPFGDPTVGFHPFGAHAYNAAMRGTVANGVRRVSQSSVSEMSVVFEGCPSPPCGCCLVDRTAVISARTAEQGSNTVYVYFAYVDTRDQGRAVTFTRTESGDALDDEQWAEQTSWLEPQVIDPDGEVPVMSVDHDGAVHVAYVFIKPNETTAIKHTFNGEDGAPDFWSEPAVVSDQGIKKDFRAQVAGKFQVFEMPGIAVDRRDGGGAVYVCYSAWDAANEDDLNVYVSKGIPDGNGGYVWQERVAASPPGTDPDPPGCEGVELDQFFSGITVDERGWVHLIWQEACDTGPDSQPEVYTVYAFSTDGGQCFTRYRLNSDDPLIPSLTPASIGDYVGISSAGSKVYTLYPSRLFDPVFVDYDIVSTRIDIGVNKADFNGDCIVDMSDFVTFASCYGPSGVPAEPGCFFCNLDGNLDGNCDVDLADFVIFSGLFGTSGCPGSVGNCGGGGAAASAPPDLGALAAWMVEHIPAVERESFAAQCRALAERTEDAETASALVMFADAIEP